MMPIMAGPPYEVAPSLRNAVRISFQGRAVVESVGPFITVVPWSLFGM